MSKKSAKRRYPTVARHVAVMDRTTSLCDETILSRSVCFRVESLKTDSYPLSFLLLHSFFFLIYLSPVYLHTPVYLSHGLITGQDDDLTVPVRPRRTRLELRAF